MGLRIAQVHRPTSANPYLSSHAANARWLPDALRELGHDVEVIDPSAACHDAAYDIVHLHDPGDAELSAPAGRQVRTLYCPSTRGSARRDVALSWRQARDAGHVAAVVAPALPAAELPGPGDRDDTLAFAFDGEDEAALAQAMQVATSCERGLRVLVSEPSRLSPACRAALDAHVRQGIRLDDLSADEFPEALRTSAAYLALTDTPFDMASLVAMACGTPVLTLDRHPAAEVIVHGESGWVCSSPRELSAAVDRLPLLDPGLGLSRARLLFESEAVARRYQELYSELVRGRGREFKHPELGRHARRRSAAGTFAA